MNETAARNAVMVRAYEREPASTSPWTEADRAWATQAAAQVEGEQAAPDDFIARRAALAIERLGSRDRHVHRLLRAVTWRPWLAWALAVLALAAGVAVDAIGSEKRVNLLAPPLLALLAWNLFIYLLIVARGLWGIFDMRGRGLGPLARGLARLTHAVDKAPRRHGTVPAAAFLRDWAQASGTLTAARIGRVLHIAAAAFALGALGSMYLRGIALEYRAGWESTFLDAHTVHWLLRVVLGPASAITGIALPDSAGYEALRFAAGPGAVAAPWLHLYAATVAMVVLVPRLLLALGDRWLEARQTARFPLRFDEPYFQALTRALRGSATAVKIVPYGCQLSPQAALGLNRLFTQALGARTTVSVEPAVAFGEEDTMDAQALAAGATLLVPLFSLTATPEHENHGVFIDRLSQSLGRGEQLAVLVDESPFRRQFGDGGNRRAERRDLWRRLVSQRRHEALFADLEQSDLADAERALQTALEATGSRA